MTSGMTQILYISYFNVWTRHDVHRAQAHTVCTRQIDIKRQRTFYSGVRTTGLQTLSLS